MFTDKETQLIEAAKVNANLIYDTVGGPSALYALQFMVAQMYDRALEELGPKLAHEAFDMLMSSFSKVHDHAAENDTNGTTESAIARFTH